jgi:hypothetical protein
LVQKHTLMASESFLTVWSIIRAGYRCRYFMAKLLVRTGPSCDYQNYQNTTACTLVANLPDIRTETQDVDLPPF